MTTSPQWKLCACLLPLFLSACGSGVGGTCNYKPSDCVSGLACYSPSSVRSPAYCGQVCVTNADCGGLDCTCLALSKDHFFDGTPTSRVCGIAATNMPCR